MLMRLRLCHLFVLLLCAFTAIAQYGNGWIDFNKTYYKFKIAEDGIYRIPQSVLADAGLGDIPGSRFRLYLLGEEIAIYTSSDGVFSVSDFIEFYGVQNRGEPDRALFFNAESEQLNPRYSMFTDTSTYFLTWDASGVGKRIVSVENDLSNPPPAETFYLHEDDWIYTQRALDPRNAAAETPISLSRFQACEGFASPDLNAFELDITSTLVAGNGPDARISLRFSSSTLTTHDISASFGTEVLLNSGNTSGFKLYQLDKTIDAGSIAASQLLKITDAAPNGAFAVAHIHWSYPRQMDFTGRSAADFSHPATGSMQYFELQNFAHGNADPVVYDKVQNVRLIGSRSGNTIRFILPAYTGQRNIVVASQANQIRMIDSLAPRTFADYAGDNTGYIIITHPVLRSGPDVVGQYAQYRRSAAGGAYDVNVYNIFDLYDQFGYGIEKHPQAIRNFNYMIRDLWSDARMILLIGKGVVYSQSREHAGAGEHNLLVPTFGHPGADHLLFTENGISLPDIPVGRLPVSDQTQLQAYLSKVIEYELVHNLPQTLEDRAWTKRILHMGGGADASQQSQILNLLNQMGERAITTEFGADVTTFTKTSTNTIGQSNSDLILDILQAGTSVVKFFGHSSANTLDFQINNPREWNNKGMYPIFSAMGCRAGDIHQNYASLSENFVFEPDAGVIAFVAGSGSQYLDVLGFWGRQWYQVFGQGVNTLTLGESILESLRYLEPLGSIYYKLLVEQQTLTGDPAIRFHATPGPDYLWDYQSAGHEPEVIATSDPSFVLHADVVNIGTNLGDTVLALVEQQLPDGTRKFVALDTVVMNAFRSTRDFIIPLEPSMSGPNTFFLKIDAFNAIAELPDPAAEENNELTDATGRKGFDIFIIDNRARTTYPLEFSIVTETEPELIATSTNAFVQDAGFVMELDTSPDFNSALRLRENFSGFGGVLRWRPEFDFKPGTVYYWRVSRNSESGNFLWDSSSFLYNPGGQKGWNQSHYGQFEKDILNSLDFDHNNRIDFDTVFRNIWVQNRVDFDTETLDDDPVVYINNRLRRDFFTFYAGFDAHVSVIVIDTFSGRFLRNPAGGLYGAENPTAADILLFPFNTATPESRNNLMTFLTDVIEDGMYAILFTYQRPGVMEYYPEDWESDMQIYGRSIFSVIEHIAPGSEIRSLAGAGSVPYLLYFRKNTALLHESIARQLEETLSFDYNFISRATEGDLISTLIGPARNWHRLEWDFTYSDNPEDDIVSAELVALSRTMTDTLRINVSDTQDTLLEFLDAAQYPFLFLRFHVEDVPDLTAPYVNFWRVLYDGVSDLLIDPSRGFEFVKDTLMIGQTLSLITHVENIGADVTDSFSVRFAIADPQNQTTEFITQLPPLPSGASTSIQLSQAMLAGAGLNTLFVEVNPDRAIEETTYQNNTGILNFVLRGDRSNPILDVTFDGRHLVDGDIVAAQPAIVVELHDENPYSLLDDKNAFEIFLAYPDDFDYTQIDINTPEIVFQPATSVENNMARLIFRPTLEEGLYDMLIRAHDRAGNDAGMIEYKIAFEVMGDRLLSRVTAEPNRFYDHTRFVFTLSGNELPAEISLQISDAAGRIVRTIGKDEIGLFVGTTEYVWDGTSDSGNLLSGGVYFYRLIAKDANGNEYDFLGPGISGLRDARVGKLVILR